MPAKGWLWGAPACALGVAVLFLASGASDDLASRRLKIAEMPPAEQQELLRKQERFLALPDAEQQRLRSLQASIDSDPNAQQLLHVMARYHEWLKTLSPSERAELGDLAPDKRVKRIKEIQQRQHASRLQLHRAQLLTPQDMRTILDWSEEIVWQNRDKLLPELPDAKRETFNALDVKKQRRWLLMTVLDRSRRAGGMHALAAIHPQDIEMLSAQLGESARQELAQDASLQEQRKIVVGWIRVAVQQRSEAWQASRRASPVVDDDVAQFFQHDLKPQQDRLLRLPNDQMRDELRRMYWEHERGEPGPRPKGKGFDRGKGPHGPRGGRPPMPPEKRDPAEPSIKP